MEPASVARDPARALARLRELDVRALRRAARRVSLCEADADDAVQRSFEILLTKGDRVAPGRLGAWMAVVARHEALAVRRSRERLLSRPPREGDDRDSLERLEAEGPDPLEAVMRTERFDGALAALALLKPDERTAIVLQAQGYSYAEICSRCGWTYTKVNRALAEGRARLRRGSRSE